MAAHKLAEFIKQWADGIVVQWRPNAVEYWQDLPFDQGPLWTEEFEYRIKPAEPERERYPETQMTATELCWEYDARGHDGEKVHQELRRIANAALRHACDKGQIVTRAEFDRAVGDRQKRDMAVAKAVTVRCYWNVGDSLEAHKLHDRMTEEVLKDVISQVK